MPEELARVVEMLLGKDPDARYASAEALLADLRVLKTGLSTGKRDVAPVASGSSFRGRVWVYGGAVLVLLMLAAFVAWQLFSGAGRRIDSIAVLPLADLSGDPEQAYLADGMTDALIDNLGHIEALRVISRTSMMRYKETTMSLPEIAQEVNVASVVEGSFGIRRWRIDDIARCNICRSIQSLVVVSSYQRLLLGRIGW